MNHNNTQTIFDIDITQLTNEHYDKIDNKLPINITPEVINLALKEERYHEFSRMIFKYYVLMDM